MDKETLSCYKQTEARGGLCLMHFSTTDALQIVFYLVIKTNVYMEYVVHIMYSHFATSEN